MTNVRTGGHGRKRSDLSPVDLVFFLGVAGFCLGRLDFLFSEGWGARSAKLCISFHALAQCGCQDCLGATLRVERACGSGDACLVKALRWAATIASQGANGVLESHPTGDACYECYQHWKTHHLVERGSESWSGFINRCRRDSAYKQKVDAAKIAADTQDCSIPAESAESSSEVVLRLRRTYTVLNEQELSAALSMPKISKAIKDRLSAFRLPKAAGVEDDETLYAFRSAAHPYRELTVEVAKRASGSVTHLASGANAWSGEGAAFWRSQADKLFASSGASAVATKLSNRAIRTLDDFAASVKSERGQDKKQHQSGDDEASGSDSGGSGSGSGSESASCDEDAVSTSGAPFGLARSSKATASPSAKKRPPVPMFGQSVASPSQRSTTASSSMRAASSPAAGLCGAPSAASSRASRASHSSPSGSDDDDDGDDEEGGTRDGMEGSFFGRGAFGGCRLERSGLGVEEWPLERRP